MKFVRTMMKLAKMKPLREFVIKLVMYYQNDKKFDRDEVTDLAITLLSLFGVEVTINTQGAKSTQINIRWVH